MILAILQARLSSSRLPGKVLLPLAGAPMLLRQIERVARAQRIDQIVVATSIEPSDDRLAQAVEAAGLAVHRGPLDNVLARFIGALEAWPADHVVRLTGDCPLIDPGVIDQTIALHLAKAADYTHNRYDPSGYPKGQDVEVISADALQRTAREDHGPEAREHVTWAVRNAPSRYRIARLDPSVDEGEVRWTVDTADDYEFVRQIYDGLYPANAAFSSDDVRSLVRARPELVTFGGERRL
ncbi:glycosyltransferase family protein [Phenylobacterium sp.]|uniref:glycosyltransferase family protein n=1 Tax=Phenylobacterium sp. TaxID=1871053 RepID=UPI0027310B42|nr:glycosyltransferase family protein [Phenylobacterium sp.]MDP1616141.1 glycosyltransferase family protein [Phenylobacterium sp.]MDP1988731.1 glycosyltransferase family protein [Phenylobacterium sp.]